MMDCSEYKELSGLRPEDLEADEAEGLRSHLEACEVCQGEQGYDEELLALVDRLPRLESVLTAADIRRMDGLEDPVAAPAAPATATPSRRTWGWTVLALAAAVALALLVVPRLFEAPTEGTQRLKEAIPDAPVAASLDLQFTVESSLGGTPALTDGAEDGRYGRDESFIFGARADSPGTLTLLETGPDGQSRIVAPVDGAGWQLGESGVLTLSDDAGQRLAYQPDGAAGTYRYTALLTDAEAPAPGAADAARLARGETVSGTTLLASDTFAVEWGVGE